MSHHTLDHRNPKALLTPAVRDVLERMARARNLPIHALSVAQAREAYIAGAGILELPVQRLASVESFFIPVRDGFAMPVRLYVDQPSESGPWPVLVYLHGGGFCIGNLDTHDGVCRRLCHLAQCAVLSLDYRLAPEFKFPTAHDDAWDGLLWVVRQGGERGLDANRIAVGGDSGGGTLAAACAVQARNAGISLALQLLFYPGCAALQTSASHRTFGQGFVLENAHITYFFNHYLRDSADRHDWRFAPLDGLTAEGQVTDLSGVAPVWMGLAECDPLVDEGVMYADRLRTAGVVVNLEIYRGVVHEFIKMGRVVPEAMTAHADAARALRAAWLKTE